MSSTLASNDRVDRVVVFDLDDTLYLERDYAESGFRAVGHWVAERLGIIDFAERAMRHFTEGRRNDIFNAVFAELGIVTTHDLINRAVDVYRRHLPEICLAPDAEEFLNAARPAGLRFALVTDGYLVAQCSKIRALDLKGRGLWPLICTDLWGRDFWKPHPRAFECIQAVFGLPSDAFTYVADNPVKDFIAPKRLGWQTIQIGRPGRITAESRNESLQRADFAIESFAELEHVGTVSIG